MSEFLRLTVGIEYATKEVPARIPVLERSGFMLGDAVRASGVVDAEITGEGARLYSHNISHVVLDESIFSKNPKIPGAPWPLGWEQGVAAQLRVAQSHGQVRAEWVAANGSMGFAKNIPSYEPGCPDALVQAYFPRTGRPGAFDSPTIPLIYGERNRASVPLAPGISVVFRLENPITFSLL